MIVILLLLGAVLFVSALRNTQGQLATALEADVPGYLAWAVAILAIGAVGYVAPLRPISRGLLVLVILVIVLRGYQQLAASLTGAASPIAAAAPVATPSAVYTAEAGGGAVGGPAGGFGGLANAFGQANATLSQAANSADILTSAAAAFGF